MKKIPLYVPYIGLEEKQLVNEALDSGWISSKGSFVKRFEDEFAAYIGRKYAITVCNGTVALHLALEALSLPKETAVICPTLTYVATANAIRYAGLIPLFVDCQKTGVIELKNIEKGFDYAAKNNITVSAIMPVHLYGNCSNMDEITNEYQIPIIEDCAESFGSTINNKMSGSHNTEFACFSFFGNKTVTTGEGGMVVCNDKELYEKCCTLKSVGQKPQSPQRYLHVEVGYNYRMTNLTAAIGCAQLTKVTEILAKKRFIAETYKKYFSDKGIKDMFLPETENSVGNNWLVTMILKNAIQREGLMLFLEHYGIETRPAFLPIHSMVHLGKSFRVDDLSNSEDIGSCGINLPSFPALKQEEIIYICDKIYEFVTKY